MKQPFLKRQYRNHTEKEPGLAVGFLFVYEIVCVISLE